LFRDGIWADMIMVMSTKMLYLQQPSIADWSYRHTSRGLIPASEHCVHEPQ
jgi:hypothetical protein